MELSEIVNQDNYSSVRLLCQVLDNSTRRLSNTQSNVVKNEHVMFFPSTPSVNQLFPLPPGLDTNKQTPSKHWGNLSFTENTIKVNFTDNFIISLNSVKITSPSLIVRNE